MLSSRFLVLLLSAGCIGGTTPDPVATDPVVDPAAVVDPTATPADPAVTDPAAVVDPTAAVPTDPAAVADPSAVVDPALTGTDGTVVAAATDAPTDAVPVPAAAVQTGPNITVTEGAATTGSTVSVSGTLNYAKTDANVLRVDIVRKEESGKVTTLKSVKLTAPGPWQASVDKNAGAVTVIGTVGAPQTDPGPGELIVTATGLTIADRAISGVDLNPVRGGVAVKIKQASTP